MVLACLLPYSHRREKKADSFKNVLDEAPTMIIIVKWLFSSRRKEPRNIHVTLVYMEG